jgi:KDEL-tailed cysteine endopeptidase
MKNSTIAILITTAVVLAGVGFNTIASRTETDIPNLRVMFRTWSQRHGKSYGNSAEFEYRLRVFAKNYIEVKTTNAAQSSYRLSLNKFADMTAEEVETKMMGYRPRTVREEPTEFFNGVSDAPVEIDWVSKGKVNAVKDQGQCGSCWAFSAIASLESNYAINFGDLKAFSEQELVDCSKSYGNHGCNGGLMDNAFKYIKDKGIETETEYPYKGVDQHCNASGDPTAKVSGWTDIKKRDQDALKNAVAETVVSIAIHANSIVKYQSGVFNPIYCSHRLNHGVAIVGYSHDGASGFDYWIVRNSWGASWGQEGYIWMLREEGRGAGVCGLALAASYPAASKP